MTHWFQISGVFSTLASAEDCKTACKHVITRASENWINWYGQHFDLVVLLSYFKQIRYQG